MSAADAFGITLNNTPDLSVGSYKKLRDLEGSGSGDFNAVITAKISTSIQDLKSAGNMRSADTASQNDAFSSVNDISSRTVSKNENASYERASSRIKNESYDKKADAPSYDGKVKDALEKFESDVKDEIKKVLDVSDEDIEEAMDKLSLSYVDLSDVSKLSMLFMELSGVTEQSELLLTDGFLELKNSVAGLSEELFKETGFSVSELNMINAPVIPEEAAMTDLKQNVAATGLSDISLQSEEEPPVNNDVASVKEEDSVVSVPSEDAAVQDVPEKGQMSPLNERTKEPLSEDTKVVDKDGKDTTVSFKEASSDGAKEVASEDGAVTSERKRTRGVAEDTTVDKEDAKTEDLQKEPLKNVSPEQNQSFGSGQSERGNEHTANANIFNNNTVVSEALTETSEVPVTPYTQQSINPSDIARQMVQGVRTVITESLKTMEVQLNPENLGRMIIHVSEQDGQLTARINIQNENVRAAMEEQMAIVKNNLEAQGLKVESVTVTADAHEFERNLEEGNAPKNDMNSSEGNKADADPTDGNDGRRQGVRSLNMNELEGGTITDLNEDELLAARIMRENGSTLNINA